MFTLIPWDAVGGGGGERVGRALRECPNMGLGLIGDYPLDTVHGGRGVTVLQFRFKIERERSVAESNCDPWLE